MEHVRSRWESCRGALVGVLGCCLLTGCTLVSRDWFGTASEDAGTMEAGLDGAGPVRELEGDGVRPRSPADRPTPARDDAGPSEGDDAGSDVDGGNGSSSKPEVVPGAGEAPDAPAPPPQDAGPFGEPEADVGDGKDPEAGGPAPEDAGTKPVEAPPGPDELTDAIDAEEEARTEQWCDCAANRVQCARSGFESTSCEEWGLSLLANTSETAVVSLLTCLLTAEEAYTECVDGKLDCQNPQASVRGCTRSYQLATTRCNNTSVAGLSVQQLCSR